MSASGKKQTPKNRTCTVEDIAAILGKGAFEQHQLRFEKNGYVLTTSHTTISRIAVQDK